MIPRQLRLKLLEKMAQTTTPASTTPPAPTGNKGKSPPASSLMPTLANGWGPLTSGINTLVASVDNVILAGTNNKHNFGSLFQTGFPAGVDSEFPPPNPTKDAIGFGRLIYNTLLNGGVQHPFNTPLNRNDMRIKINTILQNPQLLKFQQVNVSGPLGQSNANLSDIRANLLSMLNSIPIT